MINVLGLKIFDTDDVSNYSNYIQLSDNRYRVIDRPANWSDKLLNHYSLSYHAKFLIKQVDVLFYELSVGQVSFVFTLYPNNVSDSTIYSIARSIHTLLLQNGLKSAVLVNNKHYVNEIIHIRSKEL